MPNGACHPPRGTRPDVYARSVQKPTLRSCFAWTDENLVSRIMTVSSSESEDNLFLLEDLVWILPNKGKRRKKTCESKSLPFLFDRSVSVDFCHLCADWPGELSTCRNRARSKLRNVSPPDEATHRLATHCYIRSRDKITASEASCWLRLYMTW